MAARSRQSLSPYQRSRHNKTVAALGTCTSLSPTPQPYNPTFTKRTKDEVEAFIWLAIRTGLCKTADKFLEEHPHLYNYFPEPPPGKTKKRPIQKFISNKNRPSYSSKLRKPLPGEIPTRQQAPDAYAFVDKFKKARMSAEDTDEELSLNTPPQIDEELPAAKPRAAKPRATKQPQAKGFVPDPPVFTNKPPKIISMSSEDPPAKPDGVLSFADIQYETALLYQHVYAASPDHSTQPGSNFLIWRTPEVKVKEGKNENVVDKLSILIDLGSEAAVELTTRAFIEEDGCGLVVYTPLHCPHLTMLWEDVKQEIKDLSENGADGDAGPMMTAVSNTFFLLILTNARVALTYCSARDLPYTGNQPPL